MSTRSPLRILTQAILVAAFVLASIGPQYGLNPQPLPPGGDLEINPQPLPPGLFF